ncbi:MAG: hypothetical protein EZS28_023367, partial [Streblomastix strix]
INSPSSESESESLKEKDSKIQQLEESNKHKDAEINKLKQENQKEKQEKERERNEKERKDSEINILKQENQKEKQEKERERIEKERKVSEINILKQENQKEKQEKERERNEKQRKEEEINKLKDGNKKIKEEIEKLKPKPSQVNSSVNSDFPIAIHNPDPSDIDFSDIDGIMKKITKKQDKPNTISLTEILENGIWEIETEFSVDLDSICIGVMKDSFNFTAGQHSSNCSDECVSYSSKQWIDGQIYYKRNCTSGNEGYSAGQKVKEQFDSEKGTLIFFVDGVQQPVYISGIKEKVRFFFCMQWAGSSCTIRSLKKLSSPTSGHFSNEKAIQW